MSDSNVPGLTGAWYGNYYYSTSATPYGFEIAFLEDNGVVTGNILDLGVHGEAGVTGSYAYPAVDFVKTYYVGGQTPVQYSGVMSPDGKTITGAWQIPPLAKGRWIAWRVDEEDNLDESIRDKSEDLDTEIVEERPLVPVRLRK